MDTARVCLHILSEDNISMRKRFIACRLGLAVLAGMAVLSAAAAPLVPAVIQSNYDEAVRHYQQSPSDDQAAWQLARACFDRAEYSRDDAERAGLANEGITASRKVIEDQPNLAAGHYYLAMNLAQLARTKLLGSLPILGQMEEGWKTSITLDEKIDYAGPDRFLGQLYRDAPGWPISLGSKKKARQHLLRAVELCPGFPENYLDLIESYMGWGDTQDAIQATEKLHHLWPAAQKEFTGKYWAESWKDWNSRMEKIDAKLNAQSENTSLEKK